MTTGIWFRDTRSHCPFSKHFFSLSRLFWFGSLGSFHVKCRTSRPTRAVPLYLSRPSVASLSSRHANPEGSIVYVFASRFTMALMMKLDGQRNWEGEMESRVEVSVSCASFHSGHPDRAALRTGPFSPSPVWVRMIPICLWHAILVHLLSLVHLLPPVRPLSLSSP
jgi:hypothetical protein